MWSGAERIRAYCEHRLTFHLNVGLGSNGVRCQRTEKIVFLLQTSVSVTFGVLVTTVLAALYVH